MDRDKAKKLISNSIGQELLETLTSLGWEGQLMGSVILSVSRDGQRVEEGEFFMRGRMSDEPVTVTADKIWDGAAKDVVITIAAPDGGQFSFANGSLQSDYLPGDALKFSVSKNGQVILPADWEQYKIGDCCFRCFAYLDKGSNAKKGPGASLKFVILMYNASIEQLAEISDRTQSSVWPGLKILEGNSVFFPRCAIGSWGSPFVPILNVGGRGEPMGDVPSGDELRFAISCIMRTARMPVACGSRAGVLKKVSETLSAAETPAEIEPAVVWPEMARPAPIDGKEFSV